MQEPPFRDNKLLPLSPPRSRGPLSPSLGSSLRSRLSRDNTVVSPSGRQVSLLQHRVETATLSSPQAVKCVWNDTQTFLLFVSVTAY